jgi:predicted nucleic acid-binding Zn ribbon protein
MWLSAFVTLSVIPKTFWNAGAILKGHGFYISRFSVVIKMGR